jgi:hypothetical protein
MGRYGPHLQKLCKLADCVAIHQQPRAVIASAAQSPQPILD